MRPLLFLVAFAASASVAHAQTPLPSQGTVTAVGEVIEVDLEGAAEAPIGARVLTMRTVDVGRREVGVLTGVYRIIRDEWPIVRAIPDPDAEADLPGASRGDRASLAEQGEASELVILSDPEEALLLWDGQPLGTTGDTLTIAPGRYAFSVEKSGFEPQAFEVEVPVGRIRSESISLGQTAGGAELFTRAQARFAACEFSRARDLASEAISAGLQGEQQSEAFALFEAMRRFAPAADRARRMGADTDQICDAGSAMHLFVKGQSTNDDTTKQLACEDMRRALPDDPLVRQTCPS
ncbi:MAG: PEGA domain-containing protein [Bacteroidota bacterium]